MSVALVLEMLTIVAPPPIAVLWKKFSFEPNENQEFAICYTGGPLYLPAGPGFGKTRVPQWRTLNLIVYHDVAPIAALTIANIDPALADRDSALPKGIRTILTSKYYGREVVVSAKQRLHVVRCQFLEEAALSGDQLLHQALLALLQSRIFSSTESRVMSL